MLTCALHRGYLELPPNAREQGRKHAGGTEAHRNEKDGTERTGGAQCHGERRQRRATARVRDLEPQ